MSDTTVEGGSGATVDASGSGSVTVSSGGESRSQLVTYIIGLALLIAIVGYIGIMFYVAKYNPQEGVWSILSKGQGDLKEITMILGSGLLGALKTAHDAH